MKIIGLTGDSHREPDTFIVELTQAEMRRIVNGDPYDGARNMPGTTVDICKKYDEAMKIRGRCYEAAKLPEALVAIADVLRLVVPQATVIADGVAPKEDEFDER